MISIRRFFSSLPATEVHQKIGSRVFEVDSMTNATPRILSKLDANLLTIPGHPLNRIKTKIYDYFSEFHHQDMLDPIVSVQQNFDELGFPQDHVGRTLNDSYYINRSWMLRTHMTAHEKEMIVNGHISFLMAGSVFRRDEIDATHYPVFHQLEGVHIFKGSDYSSSTVPDIVEEALAEKQPEHSAEQVRFALGHLQSSLDGLLRHLFGPTVPIRWQSCYFPFTQPSLEVEVEYRGRWVEVLGSGLLQKSFLQGSGLSTDQHLAWAFGLGLERLAMVLYDIPDIRLFWSKDPRFLSQFDPSVKDEGLTFKAFSKYPHVARDISFWVSSEFSQNSFYDLVRSIAGDLVETASMVNLYQVYYANSL